MSAQRLVKALDEAAKRGKLPEFEPATANMTPTGPSGPSGPSSPSTTSSPAGAPLFTMLAYGSPWDADLVGELNPPANARNAGAPAAIPSGEAEATIVRFRLQLRRRQPLIFAIVLVLTVEPGRYFTDELLANFMPSLHGHIPTWWWWYPLTIIPIPWLWRGSLRKSRRTTAANARERIGQMAEIVGGEVVE